MTPTLFQRQRTIYKMDNDRCVISPITDVGPVCGGHGQCLPYDPLNLTFACVCEEGWFGGSDFHVTSSLTDCHVPTVAITVLWAVYLVIHVLIALTYVPRVRYLVGKHKTLADSAKQKGRQYKLTHNKPLLALVPYFVLGWPMQLVYAAYKLANIRTYLAQDVVLTVTYILWRTTFFFAIAYFQSNFLASLLTNEKKMQQVVRQNFFMTKLHFVVMTLLSVCLIVPAAVGENPFNPIVGMWSVAVFLLLTSVGMLLIGVHATFVKKQVVDILERSFAITHDIKTRKLCDRFTKFQSHNVRTAYLQFVIYGFYGAFPFMWNKHEWLVPIAWVPVVYTIKQCLDSLIENADDFNASSTVAGTQDKKASTLAASDNLQIHNLGE